MLMAAISKNQADAYDKMIEAAGDLAELIELSGIKIGEYELEELTIYLAKNALKVKSILKPLKRLWP